MEEASIVEGVRVSALASGSSGNAFLLEAGGTRLLFDAGLNAHALEHYLHQRGVSPAGLAAIFVSHEHIDHLRGVGALARRYGLPVIATRGTFLAGEVQFGVLPERLVQPPGGEVTIGPASEVGDARAGKIVVRTFSVSHDAFEPTGFWIEAAGFNIVICTDLGCATGDLHEPLRAADLLVLEANHDVQKLWRGPYHPALKRRVAGPRGHLSNADATQLISDLSFDGRRRTVWLAHLSAANNTPDLALAAVTEPLRKDGRSHLDVAVLARDKPSLVWRPSQI